MLVQVVLFVLRTGPNFDKSFEGRLDTPTFTSLLMPFPSFFEATSIKFKSVFKAMEAKGYKINSDGNYHLNVVGVRRTKIKIDEFNDALMVFYPLNGQWMHSNFQITTIPGLTYLSTEMANSNGTAILIPGQYVDKFCIDKHNGAYDALCQKDGAGHEVTVWRDDNKDGKLNPDKTKIHKAKGINIHRANSNGCSISVQSYSAGCQVFRCAAQFKAFMDIVRAAKKEHGNSFTYTLLDEADL